MSTLIRLIKRHFWCSYDVLMPCLQNRFFQIYYISCHMYNIYLSMPACQPIMFYYYIFFSVAIGLISVLSFLLFFSCGPCCVNTHSCCFNPSHPFGVLVLSKGDRFIYAFSRRLFFRLEKLVGNGKGWNEITWAYCSCMFNWVLYRPFVEMACQSLGVK